MQVGTMECKQVRRQKRVVNNMWDNAVTHTDELAAWLHKRIHMNTFEKRLNIGTSYFNQAKTNLYSLFLKIKLDFFQPLTSVFNNIF